MTLWVFFAGAQLANFVGGGEAPPSWGGRGGAKIFWKNQCEIVHFRAL